MQRRALSATVGLIYASIVGFTMVKAEDVGDNAKRGLQSLTILPARYPLASNTETTLSHGGLRLGRDATAGTATLRGNDQPLPFPLNSLRNHSFK